jgi:hypothetical protein
MDRTEAMSWVVLLCSSLRRSQSKTLSELVASGLEWGRASLAELGRCVSVKTGVPVKHCIKRVDRFIGNHRIEPIEAMRGPVAWLAKPRQRLLVSLDWVEIRSFLCIVLAARLRGRAVPLLWSVHQHPVTYRSQNNWEYGLLRALRTMVPESTHVVILADRGFGRTEMARECQKLGFDYIIRIRPDVWIEHPNFTGKLLDLPVRPGTERILRNVSYRKRNPVCQHVAVLWQRERPEPWFLMTNLPRLGPVRLTKIFGRRMTIEEYFRDAKSKRNGFALRLTLVRDPQRLGRLLLVLALIYWLLVMIGLYAHAHLSPSLWCSNNRSGECSLFTIGKFMRHYHLPTLTRLANALRREILGANWG